MEKIIPAVGIVVFQGKNVLLVRHKPRADHLTGTYGLPAGRIQQGENAEGAAVRELVEETGLTTTKAALSRLPNKYIATIERKDGPQKFDLMNFLCRRFSGNIIENEETQPVWVKISELDNYNLLPNVKKIILEAQKSYK